MLAQAAQAELRSLREISDADRKLLSDRIEETLVRIGKPVADESLPTTLNGEPLRDLVLRQEARGGGLPSPHPLGVAQTFFGEENYGAASRWAGYALILDAQDPRAVALKAEADRMLAEPPPASRPSGGAN